MNRNIYRLLSGTVVDRSLLHGSCACGNIKLKISWPLHANQDLQSVMNDFKPRACDCRYCKKHGAAYVSHPQGELIIKIANSNSLGTYYQGGTDNLARFCYCKQCGTLTHVLHHLKGANGGHLLGAVNYRTIDDFETIFTKKMQVSPRLLSTPEKIQRWQENWFAKVSIHLNEAE
jgi:hypothetical protein